MNITIALDAMGGDQGPSVVVPAALEIIRDTQNVTLILVGDQEVIIKYLRQHSSDVGERLKIQHASQVVEMDDGPASALRNKKDSSMRVALDLVKQGSAMACVSAGNTGALMAISRFVLKTIPGVDRPAIIKTLPSMTGRNAFMLDLGANVDSTAEQLFQFALMGSVLASAVENKTNPTVGLLNIGEEDIKGNEQVKQAASLLSKSDLNYYGFVEGDDVYKGAVDVVVCDGFVGNVALKTTEGVARMISHYLKEEFKRTWWTKLSALVAQPVLNRLKVRIDPRSYNGATFIGLRGTVIKSHGGTDVVGFVYAIKEAILEVEKDVPARIGEQLNHLLQERQAG